MKPNACRRFIKRNPRLFTGLFLLALLLFVAAAAPLLAPHDPTEISAQLVMPPSAEHLLGTDNLGRDVLSILIFGSRASLMVGITAAVIAAVVGTLLGVVAGYFGGKVDLVVGEFINAFMMMPTFFLVLIIIALFGSGMFKVMVVIGLTGWTGNANHARAGHEFKKPHIRARGGFHRREPHEDFVFPHHPQRPLPHHFQHGDGRLHGDYDGGEPLLSRPW